MGKSTPHFGAATLDFEHPTHIKKTFAVNIPEGGSLVQDAALQPNQ